MGPTHPATARQLINSPTINAGTQAITAGAKNLMLGPGPTKAAPTSAAIATTTQMTEIRRGERTIRQQ